MRDSAVFVAAVAAATIAPASMAILGVGLPGSSTFGFFAGDESTVQDRAGDAAPVLQQANSSVVPEVKGYHDITSASVKSAGDSLLLTINLAGDPNLNDKYETNYMWNIISDGGVAETDHYFVLMLLNFAPGFNHTAQGWFYALYDRTHAAYVVPQTGIGAMPSDRVEFALDPSLIGNPHSFRYWVSAYTRVNNTSFDLEPEYLMDYAP